MTVWRETTVGIPGAVVAVPGATPHQRMMVLRSGITAQPLSVVSNHFWYLIIKDSGAE